MIPKTIIITGAAGQLGQVVTRIFLEKGYRVLAFVHKKEKAKLLPQNPMLEIIETELLDGEQCKKTVNDLVSRYENIDAAFMLAGGFAAGDLTKTNSSDIAEMIRLNFDTAYHISQPLLSHMISKNYGRLIFIGARPAIVPAQGRSMVAYGMAKSLVFRLVEYINAETRGMNVAASILVPSTIDTPANRSAMPGADFSKWVKPETYAEIMHFLMESPADSLKETVLKVYGDS